MKLKDIFYAVSEATVNNFVGLFIIFLFRVVLFRVTTLHNVIVATEYVLGCLEGCYHYRKG